MSPCAKAWPRRNSRFQGFILLRHSHIVSMAQWQKSYTREPTRTKAELREMLTEPSAYATQFRPRAEAPAEAKATAAGAAYVE